MFKTLESILVSSSYNHGPRIKRVRDFTGGQFQVSKSCGTIVPSMRRVVKSNAPCIYLRGGILKILTHF